MVQEFQITGVIFVLLFALILNVLVIYLLNKKQEWTLKKRGFLAGGLICLISAMSIVLGMFSYFGSCTKFVDFEICGQFSALIYPANIIFALFWGIPASFLGALIGWVVGKMKSDAIYHQRTP